MTAARKPKVVDDAARTLRDLHVAFMDVEFHDGWAMCRCPVAEAIRWINEREAGAHPAANRRKPK